MENFRVLEVATLERVGTRGYRLTRRGDASTLGRLRSGRDDRPLWGKRTGLGPRRGPKGVAMGGKKLTIEDLQELRDCGYIEGNKPWR